jgi:hypothetical protein
VLHYLFAPDSGPELSVYYLIWISIFLAVNIVWDIATPKTPPFHFTSLGSKVSTVHNAAFFCSSLLLVIAVIKPDIWNLAKESYIPNILAGVSGILTSLPAICPYKL